MSVSRAIVLGVTDSANSSESDQIPHLYFYVQDVCCVALKVSQA